MIVWVLLHIYVADQSRADVRGCGGGIRARHGHRVPVAPRTRDVAVRHSVVRRPFLRARPPRFCEIRAGNNFINLCCCCTRRFFGPRRVVKWRVQCRSSHILAKHAALRGRCLSFHLVPLQVNVRLRYSHVGVRYGQRPDNLGVAHTVRGHLSLPRLVHPRVVALAVIDGPRGQGASYPPCEQRLVSPSPGLSSSLSSFRAPPVHCTDRPVSRPQERPATSLKRSGRRSSPTGKSRRMSGGGASSRRWATGGG